MSKDTKENLSLLAIGIGFAGLMTYGVRWFCLLIVWADKTF